jgi:hypothetical protein
VSTSAQDLDADPSHPTPMAPALRVERSSFGLQPNAMTAPAQQAQKLWSEWPVTIRHIGVGNAALCRLSYTRLAARL